MTGVKPPDVAFRVGLSHDFTALRHLLLEEADLSPLEDPPYIGWEFLAEHPPELRYEDVAAYDALLVYAGTQVAAATLAGARNPAVIALFGVGFDHVDVEACTSKGVLVTTSPDGVRRPMAIGAIAFLLALTHNLVGKDRAAREAGWPNRFAVTGTGLAGRTLGLVGFGNIGKEIARVAKPLGLRQLAYSPRLDRESAARAGAESVDLPTLLRESDYVCLACPLTPATHHLIGSAELGLMKPSAFLINVSRGAVVDEGALVVALRYKRIAGAALDVFATEPLPQQHPLLRFDNVLLAPHAIGYTRELFRGCVASACRSMIEVTMGREPQHLLNPAVLQSPLARQRLGALRDRYVDRGKRAC